MVTLLRWCVSGGWLLAGIVGCTDGGDSPKPGDSTAGEIDLDGDGYPIGSEDCDDSDAAIHPGAEEVCDGIDNDCDGAADAGATDAAVWYADGDGDGYGDDATATAACDQPGGGVAAGGDCDDGDAAIYPGAEEACDQPVDANCDGSVGYADADGDGFAACEDCDDGDATINPAATEVCDGADQDCDGAVDEEAADAGAWYLDVDGDGYGDPTLWIAGCEAPPGYVAEGTDCNDADTRYAPGALEVCGDTLDFDCDGRVGGSDNDRDGFQDCDDCDDGDAAISPAALEVCDGVDNNCSGAVDEAAVDAADWYADIDADGFGDAGAALPSCAQPAGYVADATDCDDGDAGVYPGAGEYCDGEDDDCDGSVDEAGALDVRVWYLDADGDGFGDSAAVLQTCEQPIGYARYDGDCDDGDAAYNPGAIEADCNDPNDYNCDGSSGYTDGDGDGQPACAECDDGDASTYPGAPEACDSADNDCDGSIDEGATGAPTWYEDGDGDGFGDPAISIAACGQPVGYVADDTDCDDARALTNPDAGEYCNGEDDDCDGTTDEASAIDAQPWYRDVDGDGRGVSAGAISQCTAPAGYAASAGDCDDGDAGDYPGAAEIVGNSDDEDCDGRERCFDDVDDDGYLDGAGRTRNSADTDCADAFEGTTADPTTDCDDADAADHPGAAEVCNGDDEDCDGAIDDGVTTTYYRDADGDGYGTSGTTQAACAAPTGYTTNATDCDDTDAADYPGAAETVANGDDEDCDGGETCYDDDDNDGYLDTTGDTRISADTDCLDANEGTTADPTTDCDDTDSGDYPGAAEVVGNGDDENCDGGETCYDDDDNDGYLDTTNDTRASADLDCADANEGLSTDPATDCDDADSGDYPSAAETCNGDDEDCDGAIDDGVTTTYYRDSDGDGYGTPATTQAACAAPTGYVSAATDCDDADIGDYPGAAEVCNGDDEDCDGTIDDGVLLTYYRDADGDGYGDPALTTTGCAAPTGYTTSGTDCEDGVASVYPGAVEVCGDGYDQACDGVDTCAYSGVTAFTASNPTYTYVGNTKGSIGAAADAGDVTGDGIDDLLIGDRNYDATRDGNEGLTWLLPGSVTGLPTTLTGAATFRVTSSANTDARSGASVAFVGDVDGDGYGEFAVGAPIWDVASSQAERGKATLFTGAAAASYGASAVTDDSATFARVNLTGGADSDWMGYAAAGVGDIVGSDGVADWAVSAPGADGAVSNAGAVYLISGALAAGSYTPSGVDVVSVTITGAVASGYLGAQIEPLDADGDGVRDLAISAGGGQVYIFDGPFSGALTTASAGWSLTGLVFDTFSASEDSSAAIAAGDLDGDGYDDLAVGECKYDGAVGNDNGRVRVFEGSSAGMGTVAVATISGASGADKAGFSVAIPGDTNGDGFDDLVVGVPDEDLALSNAGMANLLYGPVTGAFNAGVSGAWWTGTATNHRVGQALHGIGDVDDDGWDDLLISAHESAANGIAAPYAWVVYGWGE